MLRLLPLLLSLACLAPAFADERADTQRQLEQTQKDIGELKKLLDGIQQEKSGVQKQLKSTETEMGDLEKQIKALQDELDKSEAELKRLDGEKKKLQDARIEQQRLLAIQARAAYQSGREEYLKLLLNQEHPEKFSRTLTYYDYINKARLEQLASFNETLRQLANVEQNISAQKAEQLSKQGELDSRREALAATRKERQQALAKLNSDYRERDQKLKSRQQDQAELAKVLRTIEETLARQAREAAAGAPARAGRRTRACAPAAGRPRTSHQPAARTCAGPAGLKHWRGLRRRVRLGPRQAAVAGEWPRRGALRQPARRRSAGEMGRRTDFGERRQHRPRGARRTRGIRRLVARSRPVGHPRPRWRLPQPLWP